MLSCESLAIIDFSDYNSALTTVVVKNHCVINSTIFYEEIDLLMKLCGVHVVCSCFLIQMN